MSERNSKGHVSRRNIRPKNRHNRGQEHTWIPAFPRIKSRLFPGKSEKENRASLLSGIRRSRDIAFTVAVGKRKPTAGINSRIRQKWKLNFARKAADRPFRGIVCWERVGRLCEGGLSVLLKFCRFSFVSGFFFCGWVLGFFLNSRFGR